jgi:uncharacterized protein (TIGR02722 family)
MRRVIVVLGVLSVMAGCGNNWKVDREDPQNVKDLDYRFDEDDARQIYRGMAADALSKPWIDEWMGAHEGARPIIVVGNVRNETEDYINPDLVTDPLREELLNSGRVRVFAEKDLRSELREERISTQEFSRPEYIRKVANEISADFMMLGSIKDQKERSRDLKQIINYYQTTLELIDIESGEVVWIQTEEIEKRARRR